MKAVGQMPDTDSGALDRFECELTPCGFSLAEIAVALNQMLHDEDLFAYWDESKPITLTILWGSIKFPGIEISWNPNSSDVVVSAGNKEWGRFPGSFECRAT